jgi:hypothetical protein
MAKYYNNRVKTGKLAGSVFAVRNGETIERAYQPVVMNPKSSAQIASRAKLKLMSQLSAVMGPYIAIRRQGTISTRNMFVKKNYAEATFENDKADVDLNGITLTAGIVSLPEIVITRSQNDVTVQLGGSDADIDRVVYVSFVRDEKGNLRAYRSLVITEAGYEGKFTGTLVDAPVNPLHLYVYGYGIRDNTQAAKVIFGNMEVLSANAVAELVTSRNLLESDITLTVTRFAELLPA